MNYITEPTEYTIELRTRPMRDQVTARCRALGLQASSVSGHQVAIGACARKIVALVCPGGSHALRRYGTSALWLCTVTPPALLRTCRVCGCTDADCRQCIERTGQPCHWVAADLCSACAHTQASPVQSAEVPRP